VWIIFQNILLPINMSQAFVRESDDQWLNEIPPTINALINFLTRENNGVRVYVQKIIAAPTGLEVHVMSNGLSYGKNDKGEWHVV
jgi:hypothetical protein